LFAQQSSYFSCFKLVHIRAVLTHASHKPQG